MYLLLDKALGFARRSLWVGLLLVASCTDGTGPSVVVPTQLVIVTQPSATATSGAPFAEQPTIQLRDASGTRVSRAGVVVTARLASGGGTLGGTTTATTSASGMATFTDLAITGTLGDRTLSFISSTLTAATSETIDVTVPAPEIAFVSSVDGEVGGTSFTEYTVMVTNRAVYPQELFDAAPNLPPCGLNPNASRTWVDIYHAHGQHLSGFCGFSAPMNLQSFWFRVPRGGPQPASVYIELTDRLREKTYTSNVVDVPTATQLFIVTQPSATATSGAPFAQQPTIQLQDASGNNVSHEGVVVTASIASGGETLGGTTTATTSAGGLATFTDLAITGTAGDRTLNFTSGTLIASSSETIDVQTITGGWAGTLTGVRLFMLDLDLVEAADGSVTGAGMIDAFEVNLEGSRTGADVTLTMTVPWFAPFIFTGSWDLEDEMTGVVNHSGFADAPMTVTRDPGPTPSGPDLVVEIPSNSSAPESGERDFASYLISHQAR